MAAQPTTRWQVNAYRFLVRRMQHAVVRRDVRMIGDPMRSQGRALMVGTVVACLFLAGAAVLAFFTPQEGPDDARVVVLRDSGAMFVAIDGTWHPVLNLASARLVLGSAERARTIGEDRLDGRPRGPLVGIPGAPATLVTREGATPWSVCQASDVVTATAGETTIVAGPPVFAETGGRLADDEAVVLSDGTTTYLVYDGRRAEIDVEDPAVLRVLGVDVSSARRVGPGVLAAIPESPRIAAPRVADAGTEPSYPVPGGVRVGSVVSVTGADGVRFFAVLASGVQEVSAATAQLMHFADSQGATQIPAVPPDVLTRAPSVRELDVDAFPRTVPTIVDPGDRPVSCVTWSPSGPETDTRSELSVSAARTVPVPDGSRAVTSAQADGGGPRADAVFLEPGRGAYVQATSMLPDSPRRDALFYVSDTGVRYGVVSADDATALGLVGTPARAPWPILDLLPAGPALGRDAALIAHDALAPDPSPAAIPADAPR